MKEAAWWIQQKDVWLESLIGGWRVRESEEDLRGLSHILQDENKPRLMCIWFGLQNTFMLLPHFVCSVWLVLFEFWLTFVEFLDKCYVYSKAWSTATSNTTETQQLHNSSPTVAHRYDSGEATAIELHFSYSDTPVAKLQRYNSCMYCYCITVAAATAIQ